MTNKFGKRTACFICCSVVLCNKIGVALYNNIWYRALIVIKKCRPAHFVAIAILLL